MASSRSTLFALCALGLLVFGASPLSAANAPAAAESASQELLHVPGMDFSSLSPSARKQLAEVFQDSFCYCGCPHSVGQCLRSHHPCRHSKRMASLAAALAKTGLGASEIILRMSRYYLSFADPRSHFDLDPRMCKGDPKAPVTLVEFSDFECPYCGAARPVLEKLAASHFNVRLCFQPFPLVHVHPHAKIAAQAALYARDHGKFWAMHDALFENQKHLSQEEIAKLAKGLGLSSKAVEGLFSSDGYKDALAKFRQEALSAGVRATPTVYVNGRQLQLPVKAGYLQLTVGDELEWSSHGNAWAKD